MVVANEIRKIAEAPAVALEKGVNALEAAKLKKAGEFWQGLGPGLITGAADDDPSGITTYSQAGAAYGFNLLWLAAFTFPLMAVVQEMCARLGLVTGRGLAGNIRINYPKAVLYLCAGLLFLANTINVGADIGAMAQAVQLVVPNSNFVFWAAVFTVISMLVQIFTPYERYAKYLKYLVFFLFSYIATAFIAHIDMNFLLKQSFIPRISFSKDELILITGILGTTISPYLFFWQTSHEVEEDIAKGKTTVRLRQSETTPKEIRSMRWDVWIGMFVSNLVMYFIIATCATVLFNHGIKNINSAAEAAMALRPLAGDQAFLLFALGIVGMGMLAIPTLAGSAAYAAAESFRWKSGLSLKLHQARPFYGVLMFSMLIGFAINLLGFDPIKMLIYTAVINGLIAPLILYLIVQMTSNKKILKQQVNHPAISILGWVITLAMTLAGIGTIWAII